MGAILTPGAAVVRQLDVLIGALMEWKPFPLSGDVFMKIKTLLLAAVLACGGAFAAPNDTAKSPADTRSDAVKPSQTLKKKVHALKERHAARTHARHHAVRHHDRAHAMRHDRDHRHAMQRQDRIEREAMRHEMRRDDARRMGARGVDTDLNDRAREARMDEALARYRQQRG